MFGGGLISVFSLVMFLISEKISDYSYLPFGHITNANGRARFVSTEQLVEDLICLLFHCLVAVWLAPTIGSLS